MDTSEHRQWSEIYLAWVDRDGRIVDTYEAIAARREPSPLRVGEALVLAFAALCHPGGLR